MSHTFAINGFGRIGRISLRSWWQNYRTDLDLKVINTSGSMELDDWAHLIRYDTNYGIFHGQITTKVHQTKDKVSDEDPVLGELILSQPGEKQKWVVTVTAQREPSKIPWAKFGVETVIESTGVFRKHDQAALHLKAGAKKVLISAPGKSEQISTSVLGVNHFDEKEAIRSNASCTTNSVAPVAQIMVEKFGVEKAMLTTIHSYTDDQNTQDNSHRKDLRRARSAAENIIPTTTGAAKATTQIIPELKGQFDGLAIRVPTPVGSLSDMTFVTKKATTIEEVNQVFVAAAQEKRWQGILATTSEPLVSSDIIGRSESSIVDLGLTNVIGGNLVKVVSWYDNEWGYSCRLLEQIFKQL